MGTPMLSHLDLRMQLPCGNPLGLWWLYQVVLSAAVWGMNFALLASGSEGKDLMATDSWTDTHWLNLGELPEEPFSAFLASLGQRIF